MKYREAQNDFYGKRGVTWHVTVVTRRKEQDSAIDTNLSLRQQYQDETFDDMQSSIGADEEEMESLNNTQAGCLLK